RRAVAAHCRDGVIPRVIRIAPRRLAQRGALAEREVEATHVAALRRAVDDVRVGIVLLRDEAVTATDVVPHRVGDRALPTTAGAAPRAIVLQATAHTVRHGHVERDVVELTDRE